LVAVVETEVAVEASEAEGVVAAVVETEVAVEASEAEEEEEALAAVAVALVPAQKSSLSPIHASQASTFSVERMMCS
jgi:hypothetical protein